MKPISSGNPTQNARIGERTLEVRGQPQQVAVYDLANLKAQYIEHVDGTGYPGSYRIEGSLTNEQKVTLTVDPDGKVQLMSRFFEPDPELGNVIGPEPSRYDPVRNLFPEELKTFQAAVKGLLNVDPAYGTVLERLGGKSQPEAPRGASKQLNPGDGQPLGNAGGVRGAGYDVTEK